MNQSPKKASAAIVAAAATAQAIFSRPLRRRVTGAGSPTSEPSGGELATLDALERDQICKALARVDGNKTEAAKLLGVSVRSLYTRLKRHGLHG